MSLVIAAPELMEAAATDLAAIGSTISAAHMAAAAPTTGVIPAAADEVSAAIATLFSGHAQLYQEVSAQAATFHEQFVRVLAAAFSSYANTEATNATPMQAVLNAVNAPTQALLGRPLISNGTNAASAGTGALTSMMAPAFASGSGTALVMGVGGAVQLVQRLFFPAAPLFPGQPVFPGYSPQALVTPQQVYPVFGVKNLPLDTAVSQGVTILNSAITQQVAGGNNVVVFGFSESATIASLEMRQLAALPPDARPSTDQLAFVLVGDANNPNGGVLERFDGLTVPSLGFTFSGATPDNVYPTTIYTLEYDGLADFPQYPIDLPADLNAVLGILYMHGTYPDLTPTQVATAIALPTQGSTLTTYYMIPTQNLPLLDPLRAVPVVGNPLADLIQPDLTVIVNLGYGNPDYGYSTGPANVPTPFGLFPDVKPITVLNDLVAGTQQGISQAISDLGSPSGPSFSGLSGVTALNPLTAASTLATNVTDALKTVSVNDVATATSPASMIDTIIYDLQAANTSIATTLSSAVSTDTAVLLPTADLLLALVITLPSYDLNLFLGGILQAANGNPVGLINAVGYPIAADTGLIALGGFTEVVVLGEAILYGGGPPPPGVKPPLAGV